MAPRGKGWSPPTPTPISIDPPKRQPATAGPLMTRKQVAELLQVSERTVYDMSRDGRLPQPMRWGASLIRYQRAAIEAFIADSAATTPQAGEQA